MKRITAILLTVLTLLSLAVTVNAEDKPVISFKTEKALYVHAVSGSDDTESWSAWQCVHDLKNTKINENEKYFFLPSSADSAKADIYNAYSESVTVNGKNIPAGQTASVSYEENKAYEVKAENNVYTLRFMKSGAEAAIYVNNSDVDGKGTDLFNYLIKDKSLTSTATGAIVTPDGAINNTPIKKIKGRGNTTWQAPKKPFNITYDKNVSIAGMNEGKKFSLLANFQDDSLSRNRFIYDLSDAVGMPYASDSRYVDFYMNGYYWGSFQMAEKIDVGKNSMINDFSDKDYLDDEGNVKEDFPFLCEIDASADDEDYFVTLDNKMKLTIKAPELDKTDKGYNEVKEIVKNKYEEFESRLLDEEADIKPYADIDSVAKLLIINELGKNWDFGVSSFFFTYRQDENGKFKFFGSPVWDYDNSLGNAKGMKSSLEFLEIDDYELPTGWWNERAFGIPFNKTVMERSSEIWFEKFVPAIDHFTGKSVNEEIGKDFYTAEKYFNLIEKSAEMNYKSGWLLHTSDWIADHSTLTNATFDKDKNTYYLDKNPTTYPQTFKGMYNYCRDWMVSRAAWISKELSGDDVITEEVDNIIPTEPENDGKTVEPTKPSDDTKKAAAKKANTMTVKVKTVNAKAKKKTVIKKSKAFTIKNAVGKLSFKKLSGNKKTAISKTGKITVKKGLKKGKTYKLKIKITASGNANYYAKSKTVTLKVKVK